MFKSALTYAADFGNPKVRYDEATDRITVNCTQLTTAAFLLGASCAMTGVIAALWLKRQ